MAKQPMPKPDPNKGRPKPPPSRPVHEGAYERPHRTFIPPPNQPKNGPKPTPPKDGTPPAK